MIRIFQKTLLSPKKVPAGKCTHDKMCVCIFLKKPLRENADTAKNVNSFSNLFLGRNFYASQILTSKNQVFHKEKHLSFKIVFLGQFVLQFFRVTVSLESAFCQFHIWNSIISRRRSLNRAFTQVFKNEKDLSVFTASL